LDEDDCNHLAVKGKWGIRRSNQSNRIYRNPDGSVVKKRYERNRSKSVGADKRRDISEHLKKRQKDSKYEKEVRYFQFRQDKEKNDKVKGVIVKENGVRKKRKYEKKIFVKIQGESFNSDFQMDNHPTKSPVKFDKVVSGPKTPSLIKPTEEVKIPNTRIQGECLQYQKI